MQPGTYQFEGLGRIEVRVVGGQLFVHRPGYTRYALFPAGDGWLYAPGLDIYLAAGPRTGELQWASVFLQAQGQRVDERPSP